MKDFYKTIKILPSLGQIGLSVVVPILFCVLICYWLTTKGVGMWVYIPGFFFGLGGAAASAMKLYRMHKKEEEKKDKTVAFNSHY